MHKNLIKIQFLNNQALDSLARTLKTIRPRLKIKKYLFLKFLH